ATAQVSNMILARGVAGSVPPFSIAFFRWGIVALGLLPAVVMWRFPLRYRGWRVEVLSKLRSMGIALAVILGLVVAFGSHYASFLREYKPVWRYVNPIFPLVSTIKLVTARVSTEDGRPPAPIAVDARLPENDPHRELMVMVIGEAARTDRFSLYGYERQTNPELSRATGMYVYRDVTSCGTSTAVSLPCMFSLEGRARFSVDEARHKENVLDVLQRAGVHVLWRDNNSDSKGVALRIPYQDFRSPALNPVCDVECRDVGMLHGLQDYIDRQSGDILIVLHQMGNHGPAYHRRYPPAFERFTPACNSAKLSDCTKAEIDNAYDNAILYTDWFLARVMELVEANSTRFEAAMLYVSDHGESLGERHVYLHGLPYAIAPAEQTHVPLLLWVGEHRDVDLDSVLVRSRRATTHDAISHSLLAYFEIETKALDEQAAVFSVRRETSP
ncbi:MAG TPA: sulfatase-like hydrolase/transferase, partial [Candidatus Polarisedimenticolia bacterium]|nr:sulfatase-like hydrolase/transferase [Candidatus Polarisedimenticolia bacterium]